MLFNSLEFAIFLPTVFVLYWFLKNDLKKQNLFLLIVSYIFYGWWDWRFLALIIFSSIVDYSVGLKLGQVNATAKRKLLLLVSVLVNIGFLAFFKYYNFFLDSFIDAFTFFGYDFSVDRLYIILPVGISFYTFQTLSYTIDIYRKQLEPTKDIISFFAFVSFFPQLVAGPIERAKNLLPQFTEIRSFNYQNAVDGMRQILWGLFKKMVIADGCAEYVNLIFSDYTNYSGSTLLLGAVLFAFQIYGDFSGYSDIAIGTARLFGFNLMRNFAYPYFSRDIAEFWRRWHISLSTWFRDYVYIPMGGSRVNWKKQILNIFVIFTVSGFWHGANWTFIFWGALNACYFLPLMISGKNRVNTDIIAEGKILPSIKETIQLLNTFFLTTIAWIFFRAESLFGAFDYLSRIFSSSFFNVPEVSAITLGGLIIFMLTIEWLQRDKEHALELHKNNLNSISRWAIYYCLFMIIYIYGNFSTRYEFIYFQF